MATITYLQKYINKETGSVAFLREQVLNLDGSFFGCRERDYGHGAGVSITRITKPYKTATSAEKALVKIQESQVPGGTVYNRMTTSRW